MRSLALGVMLAVGIGCSSQPPSVKIAQPIQSSTEPDFVVLPKPAGSDPAAQALLKECLEAHTGGAITKLAKFKQSTMTRTGLQDTGAGNINAEWQSDISWPTKYRFRASLTLNDGIKILSTGNTPIPWGFQSFQETNQPMPREQTKVTLNEFALQEMNLQFREDAVHLLFPLAEESVLVTSRPDSTLGGKPHKAINVWTSAVDYLTVTIDPESKLIARIKYQGQESGKPVPKTFTYGKYGELAGVKFPQETEVATPQRVLARWNKLQVVTKDSFPDKLFEGP
jgi:hypothetical protein